VLTKALRHFDVDSASAVIEKVIKHATRERESRSRRQLSEVKAAAQERLVRLLTSSPAVIYSFKASGDFAPTFVSDNIGTVFGYTPAEYLENPAFWRDRVHPDDLPRVEEAISKFFHNGVQSVEYRFRRRDGSYCWVNEHSDWSGAAAVSGAVRRFGTGALRRRALASLLLALERRRIAYPKAEDYADFQRGLQQGFAAGEMGFRGQSARQQSWAAHVRFGSLADVGARSINVRFTPKSGHHRAPLGCPLSAKSRQSRAAVSVILLSTI